MLAQLQLGEGGIFRLGNGLAFVGADSLGLLTATNAYVARAPYQWSVPGPKLQELAEAINGKLAAAKLSAQATERLQKIVDENPGTSSASAASELMQKLK